KLSRLLGSDHVHTTERRHKFYATDAQLPAAIAAVREPLLGGYHAVPVLSSGQTAALAPRTYQQVASQRLLVLSGGGIHGHPGGSAAGVRAMREAWSAALAGVELTERAREVPELAAALDTFGPPR